jgi:hypothetical protein
MIKKVLLTLTWMVVSIFATGLKAQINSIDDFVEKTEELRTISQKLGQYYILTNLFPTNDKYKEAKKQNIDQFNSLIVELTENAPSEELSIELQKFNLTWLYVSKILDQKYDRAAAGKILDKLEDMQQEAKQITQMALELTKKRQTEVVEKASEARMQIQRMILYFLAHKAKIINSKIPDRFKDASDNFKSLLTYLENSEFNDDNKSGSTRCGIVTIRSESISILRLIDLIAPIFRAHDLLAMPLLTSQLSIDRILSNEDSEPSMTIPKPPFMTSPQPTPPPL